MNTTILRRESRNTNKEFCPKLQERYENKYRKDYNNQDEDNGPNSKPYKNDNSDKHYKLLILIEESYLATSV